MADTFKINDYLITTDPSFQHQKYGISPKLAKQLTRLAIEAENCRSLSTINKLNSMIKRYPSVPHLKNYLSVAYVMLDNLEKAKEINQQLLAEHPDYLFGLINQANIHMYAQEYEKVPALLGETLELKDLYPERKVFHLSEVTSFLKICIRYYLETGNAELAANRFKLLKEIAPEHPDTLAVENTIAALTLKNMAMQLEKEMENRIYPKHIKTPARTDCTKAPYFNHPEIYCLYEYGPDIPQEKLQTILALPHDSLAADLEKMLDDAVMRYEFFSKKEWNERTHFFVLHAFFLLKEIQSSESLGKILEFLEYDAEFLDFWLGDHITETVWQCLYVLGFNKTSELGKFLIQPNIDTYCKTAVSSALSQLVLHHPEKRNEILEIFLHVLNVFSNSSLEDNLIDTECTALIICDAMDAKLHELLPAIKNLFNQGFVNPGTCGTYEMVEKNMLKPPKINYVRKIQNIFELYEEVTKLWVDYQENETSYDKTDYEEWEETTYYRSEPKIGRNDPCPCGSGKKYKKCCLNKNL